MVSPTVVDFGGDPDRSDRNDAAKVAAQADRSFSGQHRMAFRLAGRYAGRLLFVPDVGWHRWDSRRWATDGDRAAERAVDVVLGAAVRDGAGDAALRADVRKCESATGRKGVLDIAGSLLDLVCAADKLDADPHLLNARNGTLDLRTMEMHPHNPQDRITKVCAAAYDPDTESPTGRWERFLTEVLPDAEVRGFLARLIGLSLLGAVRENVLPIWTGLGANGKGAAYNAILHALGDYACPADPDLFMARDGAHPTGTMDLRGRRFVVVSESDKHKRMNEATMKRLTGGDPIKSRFMGKNFVTFTPSHLAVLVTNHLPKVAGDDAAVWRRLRVVPFDVVIPKPEQDSHLPDALQADTDAVLGWAVRGWQSYVSHGHQLAEPASVMAATDKYRVDSDAVARFIGERCYVNGNVRMPGAELFAAWEAWARADGAEPMAAKAFGQALERHGLPPSAVSHGVRYRPGVELRTDDDDPDTSSSRYGQ